MTWKILGLDLCPYGHWSWVVPMLSLIAYILFAIAAFDCSLTISKGTLGGREFRVFIGYWGREQVSVSAELGPDNDRNWCSPWNDKSTFDTSWIIGRTLGIVGTLAGAIFFMEVFMFFAPFPASWFPKLAAIHIANSLMSIMLLIGLLSDVCAAEDCKVGPGIFFAILAMIMWAASGYFLMKVKPIEQERAELEDEPVETPRDKRRKRRSAQQANMPAINEDEDNNDDDDDIEDGQYGYSPDDYDYYNNGNHDDNGQYGDGDYDDDHDDDDGDDDDENYSTERPRPRRHAEQAPQFSPNNPYYHSPDDKQSPNRNTDNNGDDNNNYPDFEAPQRKPKRDQSDVPKVIMFDPNAEIDEDLLNPPELKQQMAKRRKARQDRARQEKRRNDGNNDDDSNNDNDNNKNGTSKNPQGKEKQQQRQQEPPPPPSKVPVVVEDVQEEVAADGTLHRITTTTTRNPDGTVTTEEHKEILKATSNSEDLPAASSSTNNAEKAPKKQKRKFKSKPKIVEA